MSAHLDGELQPAEARELEEHARDCAACREILEGLRDVVNATSELPPDVAPTRDLWPGIESRIRWQRRRPRVLATWGATLAAAASIVIAVVVVRDAVLRDRPAPQLESLGPSPATLGSSDATLAQYRSLDADFDRTASEMYDSLEVRRAELSPETVAVVERNLQIIEAAIAETRAALAKDTSNPRLGTLHADLQRRRLETLRMANTLPRETREY